VPGHSQAAKRETGQRDAEPFGPDGHTPKMTCVRLSP
jgi:hypothetical protein